MRSYVFDTDHLSLYGRNYTKIIENILAAQVQLTTTAINVEEQLRGRLAQIAEAKDGKTKSIAYRFLVDTVMLLSEFTVLQYDAKSDDIYQSLKAQRVRIGTQDLRIASIVLACDGVLLTRNLQDFEKVPGLKIQNWLI
jgi:tRNA(fMet)-specific endonuclease VapC